MAKVKIPTLAPKAGVKVGRQPGWLSSWQGTASACRKSVQTDAGFIAASE